MNKELIIRYINMYKAIYRKQYNENPTSWFNYFQWLASFTTARNFEEDEVRLTKKLLRL